MKISNLKKNLLTCFKIIFLFVREDQNVPKPLTRAPNQIPLSRNRLELSPLSFTHVFKEIETTVSWNCISKTLRNYR